MFEWFLLCKQDQIYLQNMEKQKSMKSKIQRKKFPWSSHYNLGLFPSFSIFSIKLNQFVIFWNWFILKLFCFRFSLLRKDNKIRIVKSMNPQPKFWCTNITSKVKCKISIVINKQWVNKAANLWITNLQIFLN